MGTIIPGKIIGADADGITIYAKYTDFEYLMDKEVCNCEVIIRDGRQLSPSQRNKIFALIQDITKHISGGQKPEEFYETLTSMQLLYVIDLEDREEIRKRLTYNYCQLRGIDLFSLKERSSDTVDMTTARDFIDWLVELCIIHGIQCSDSLLERCEDQQRYLYACVMQRVCCICGQSADIHEYDTVGMDRDRDTIHHEGQRVQPLCRRHHNEVGRIGQKSFDQKYHVSWVKLDAKACERLNWKK